MGLPPLCPRGCSQLWLWHLLGASAGGLEVLMPPRLPPASGGTPGTARSLAKKPGERGPKSHQAPTSTSLLALGTLCPSDALPGCRDSASPGSLPVLWWLLLRLAGRFLGRGISSQGSSEPHPGPWVLSQEDPPLLHLPHPPAPGPTHPPHPMPRGSYISDAEAPQMQCPQQPSSPLLTKQP